MAVQSLSEYNGERQEVWDIVNLKRYCKHGPKWIDFRLHAGI